MSKIETDIHAKAGCAASSLAPCSAFMCARCGTREKMKTSPWCGYCWHIETAAPDEEDDVRPVPPGCTEAPGYILEIAGSVWLREDGSTTDVWAERGIWPTAASAREALGRFLSPNAASQPTPPLT